MRISIQKAFTFEFINMRRIEFVIDDINDGIQIRDYLKNFGVSASLLTKLKQTENGITKNGEFARAIDYVNEGDVLAIAITNKGTSPRKLYRDDVELIYNDEDILVLNKPPYMPVHESRNHQGDTLANVSACYLDEDTSFRAVYRLDRDTSGLVLIAKNELAACKLAGKIKKDYYAICQGELSGNGTIDLPIGRVGDSIIKRGVFDYGERAVTHWQAIDNYSGNTLLKINLETGRTHQIRVHFSHIGHSLLGDTLYDGSTDRISRQALHCKKIYFTHPITSKKMAIECDFPEDFKRVIQAIKY
ncbi:MAG: RluA family pseudouridine synthase [Acetobacter sp.]|nr:RluA family pseudouridine synthase [Bacteroides sp.]MCM1340214.1 RluA family pseudouridine synthase [Acetobacter sp.]MCM1432834.1 RluA family pseudouridine synthase [Clostridiales bacterium]